MNFRTGIEIYLTGNSCKTPEVLILKIRTITPAHHLHGNEIFAWFQIFGDIKLCSHLAVFAISHILAIHPESQIAGSRTYMEIYILALPVLRQVKGAAIGTRIVVEFADIRRIWVKLGSPGITDILISSVAIAIQFKQARYWKILPLRIIKVGSEKIGRTLVVVLDEIKFPSTFHRKVVGRFFLLESLSLILILESKERSTARSTILLIDIYIMPSAGILRPYFAMTIKNHGTQ